MKTRYNGNPPPIKKKKKTKDELIKAFHLSCCEIFCIYSIAKKKELSDKSCKFLFF